jgi:hypothetical protein
MVTNSISPNSLERFRAVVLSTTNLHFQPDYFRITICRTSRTPDASNV